MMTSEADSRSPRSLNKCDFAIQNPGRDFQTGNARDTKWTQLHRRKGEGAKETQLERRREEVIARICRILQTEFRGQRPLRIAFVGKYGSGKSSFVNTVAAAFSENAWREYAYTGFYGGSSEQSQGSTSKTMTVFTQSFDKCCNDKLEWYRGVPLPTLIDVAGLDRDTDDDKTQELLRLLFYGHLKKESAIQKAFEFCQCHTQDEIRAVYSQSYPEMRVDRVVFVASATDKIPERLINCVIKAARPEHYADVKRSIPIFGVLTKKDRVSDLNGADFMNKKEIFMRGLALQSNRFLCCSNYCDDIDPSCERTRQLDPNIDLPVVEFFQQLCDPALSVVQDTEELPGTGHQTDADKKKAKQNQNQSLGEHIRLELFMAFWDGLGRTGQALAASLVVAVVVWVVMSVLVIGELGSALREFCRDGRERRRAACIHSESSLVFVTTFVSFGVAAGCFILMWCCRRRK